MAVFATSQSGNGTQAFLVNSEDLYVAAGVTVGSNNGVAIASSGSPSSGHTAIIAGSVVGQLGGVGLGIASTDSKQSLTVRAGAEVIGFDSYGVYIAGHTSTLTNAGFISGGDYGAYMIGSAGGALSASNSGTIEGEVYGFYAFNSSGQTFTLTNSGTIRATNTDTGHYSVLGSGASAIKVVNSGQLVGAVYLSGSDDLYDGRKGHVDGTVFGGDGLDRLYGGTEANTLSGGAGNDSFLFDAALNAKTNVDRIVDFANASGNNDRFELDNAVFTKVKDGALLTAYFKDLGVSGAKVDSSDRILYNSKTGDLSYDADGSGSAKAVRFAHLDNHAHLTAADFMVV